MIWQNSKWQRRITGSWVDDEIQFSPCGPSLDCGIFSGGSNLFNIPRFPSSSEETSYEHPGVPKRHCHGLWSSPLSFPSCLFFFLFLLLLTFFPPFLLRPFNLFLLSFPLFFSFSLVLFVCFLLTSDAGNFMLLSLISGISSSSSSARNFFSLLVKGTAS